MLSRRNSVSASVGASIPPPHLLQPIPVRRCLQAKTWAVPGEWWDRRSTKCFWCITDLIEKELVSATPKIAAWFWSWNSASSLYITTFATRDGIWTQPSKPEKANVDVNVQLTCVLVADLKALSGHHALSLEDLEQRPSHCTGGSLGTAVELAWSIFGQPNSWTAKSVCWGIASANSLFTIPSSLRKPCL